MGSGALEAWAVEEFGHARLGHKSRNHRLIKVAAGCAAHPSGKVTSVFDQSSDREGAFRFVENDEVEAEALMEAAHVATARRCATAAFAYVPLDKSSLSLVDMTGTKRFGMVGIAKYRGQGLNVMSALAITPDGVPQGLTYQHYWARERRPKSHAARRRKPRNERETQLWLDAMEETARIFAESAPDCRPWFQIDREGDAGVVLNAAVEHGLWLTVRGAWDRRVQSEEDLYLRAHMASQPVLGSYAVELPASGGQPARMAIMSLRAARVTLAILQPKSKWPKKRVPFEIGVVLAQEQDPPEGVEPLDWLLLTTHPIDTLEDAYAVVLGYTQRWRIEEFHRAWKTGACRVEETQLRDRDHVIRWAVILASVAARIVRLSYVSRAQPDAPAAHHFDTREIKVITLLAKPKVRPKQPTIHQVVEWLAQLGGYTGKSSGGPPGFLVLARGLERIQSAVELMDTLEESDQC